MRYWGVVKMSEEITLTLPELNPAQKLAYDAHERFLILLWGRRGGKTVFGMTWIAEGALLGEICAYMTPTNKMADEVWREMKLMLAPVIRDKSEQARRMTLITGGIIDFWSLDNPDAPRGRKYHRVVMDEAAQIVSDYAFTYVVRPTLLDYKGRLVIATTPNGLNWVYTLYRYAISGDSPDWKAFQFPTSSNPHVPADELLEIKRTTAAKAYSQEFEAQFVGDGTSVFRSVHKAATAVLKEEPEPGHQYVIGADFARTEDFSVFLVLDVNTKSVVWIERTQNLDWAIQIGLLRSLANRYSPLVIVAEKNAVGDSVVQQLTDFGLPIYPFYTSNPSKVMLVNALAYAFDNGEIKIPDDPILINELLSFDAQPTSSGMTRYSAPSGGHDDMVMALMLAWHGADSQVGAETGYTRIIA